jgi:hypothetical protein
VKGKVKQFIKEWESEENTQTFRKAIAINRSGIINKKVLKLAANKLSEWAQLKLHSESRKLKSLKTISSEDDWGKNIGIGIELKSGKKDNLTVGQFITHLYLIIESKDRKIDFVKRENGILQNTIFELEQTIKNIGNNEKIPLSERKSLREKFYQLFSDDEEDED